MNEYYNNHEQRVSVNYKSSELYQEQNSISATFQSFGYLTFETTYPIRADLFSGVSIAIKAPTTCSNCLYIRASDLENKIQVIKACVQYPKLCKLSNGKILEYGYDPKIYFYSYKNGSLNKDNQIINIKKNYHFQDICEINENEIAIYSTQEARFSFKDWNDYLIFYNYQNNKKRDKEIQSYSFSESGYLCLLNANYILVVTYSKIILVDTKKMSFISDLKNSFDSMLALNENIFLGLKSRCIYQLEIDNNKKKIIEKEKKEFSSEVGCLIKYSDGKLLFKSDKNEVSIYGI